MPLLARMVAAPLTIDVRSGAVATLGTLLSDRRISAHGDVALVVGPGLGEHVVSALDEALDDRAEIFGADGGTIDAAQRLADTLRRGSHDAVVGIGGGRTLDVAKYAASHVGLPMVSVATSLAHDGLASPVASLEHEGHKGSYGVHIPIAVVVDLDYVRRAPREQLRSGVGDALSNLNAVADWRLAGRVRDEPVDGLATALARTGAESILHHDDDLLADTFLTTLSEALVLGGLAMAVAGSSRPCSGSCHEIAHAIDALHPGHGAHGEQVAVGALFCSWLREDPLVDDLDACLRRYGVPRLPQDLGLSADDFGAVVAHAPTTRPDRFTILEHLDMDAGMVRQRVDDFVHTFDR
jgi:glycerol-1-phosphate dehydrogenase [NAD(P)+]